LLTLRGRAWSENPRARSPAGRQSRRLADEPRGPQGLAQAIVAARGIHKAESVPQQHAANVVVFQIVYNSPAKFRLPILDYCQAAIDLADRPIAKVEQVGIEMR